MPYVMIAVSNVRPSVRLLAPGKSIQPNLDSLYKPINHHDKNNRAIN